jgi:hypothetical protein
MLTGPTKRKPGLIGKAKYVPQGLRVVEALLAQRFGEEDIAVCYAGQLDQFVGEDTRVVGIHAHNPLGITFATDVYAYSYGADVEPIAPKNSVV